MIKVISGQAREVVPDSHKACVFMMDHNVETAGHQQKNLTLKQLALELCCRKMKEDVEGGVKMMLAVQTQAKAKA